MRLGVDGRILSARPTGIATYALEMIKALGGLGVELFVYTSGVGEACLNGSDATTRAVLPDRRYLRGSKAQLGLGRHLRRDRVDAFWCPTHRLPFFLPRDIPSLVTVHDLVWRKYPRTMRVTGRLADRLLAPHAISNATRLIAPSRSTASDIVAFDRSADAKIAVIPFQIQHIMAADKSKNSIRMAEDVIKDTWLLARCDVFVHITSNIATAVAFLNPRSKMVYCE